MPTLREVEVWSLEPLADSSAGSVAHGLFRVVCFLATSWCLATEPSARRAGIRLALDGDGRQPNALHRHGDWSAGRPPRSGSFLVRMTVGESFLFLAPAQRWDAVTHEVAAAVEYLAALSPEQVRELRRYLRESRTEVTWLSEVRRTRHWTCQLRADVDLVGHLVMHLAAYTRKGDGLVVQLPNDPTTTTFLPTDLNRRWRGLRSPSEDSIELPIPVRGPDGLPHEVPATITMSTAGADQSP